ncbi:snoRNA-binding rRNA-processing protein utp10 [Coemansia biformis]|uniref:U3 small nucleolar RNA-associated protein 10 n=1 Tax=Coemansia biformis TaxID=1286918 RepID=A0A9W7YH88_9FUNG|nr:snoRNA-binding rRNA-processing protein utp10 [Coemansia biformis]
MASSLASQLYRLRGIDRAISTERAQKIRASFLFDGRQAADIDNQTILDIGRDGLRELRQINRRFDVYAATLFSESVKDMDRVLQTREENNKLDESIRAFLFQLAPHFLTKPAGKALEWLVRRFRIHEFNVRDILAAILPYHETKAFLTMLTIITFEAGDMDLFGFLVTQRKARRVLDRGTLLAQCVRDRSLMAFIGNAAFRACTMGLDYPGLHSFYATVMSQYISNLPEVGDAAVQFVLPYVLDGLSLHARDAQIAAYMALGALGTRVLLTADALEKALCAVAQQPADVRAMAMCLVQLVQTQEAATVAEALSPRFLDTAASHPALPQALCVLADEYDVGMLMRPLLGALTRHALAGGSGAGRLLTAVIPVIPLAYAPVLCERLVHEYVARGLAGNMETDAEGVITMLQLRFGQQLEDAIGAAASSFGAASDKQQAEAVHRLLYQLNMRGAATDASKVLPLRETATTLYLGISHADTGIRLVAAKALRDIVAGSDSEFALSAQDAGKLIVERLQHEDDEQILEIVLSLPLADYVRAEDLVPALASLLSSERVPLARLSGPIVDALLSIDTADDVLRNEVVSAVFPYVLSFGSTRPVTQALIDRLRRGSSARRDGEWLGSLAAVRKDARKDLGAEYNMQAAMSLATALVRDWAQLADASTGVWARQLGCTASLPARTAAIAVGVQAVAQLAAAGDAAQCAAATAAVVKAALDVLASSSARHLAAVADNAARTPSDSAAWTALLGGLATGNDHGAPCAQVAVAAISATLGVLAETVTLRPCMWFAPALATDGDVEAEYRQVLRTTLESIAASPGEQARVVGALAGHILRRCAGGEWAQLLAAMWTSGIDALARARCLLAFRALVLHREPGAATDYQTVLPAIVAQLADEDASVRRAAAASIKALHQVLPADARHGDSDSIYMYDAFYGRPSSKLQYLQAETAVRLVGQLAACAAALADDDAAAPAELGRILTKGSGSTGKARQLKLNRQARGSVVAFMLSHVAAADGVAPELQTRILAVLRAVESPCFVEQLAPLIAAHVARIRELGAPAADSAEDQLVRAMFRACYAPGNAEQLAADGECWATFLDYAAGAASAEPASWTSEQRARAYVQQVAFERLAAGLAPALGDAAVAAVTACLLDAAARGAAYDAPAAATVRGLFGSIVLDAGAAADAISAIAERLDNGAGSDGGARAGKRARAVPGAEAPVLAELAALLEHVQCSAQLAGSPALVPGLMALLGVLVTQQTEAAYATQLALAMLTRIFEEANAGSVPIAESVVRVDTVVQAIRTSGSPQTHNQALLLLAAVAAQHPDAVLHHAMAVFTFMGANVLRQDDTYSLHVIQQTLRTIVPALVGAGADGGAGQAARAGPVLRVFVDSLTHIPRHRRMALFTTLVQALGADTHAAAVTSLLLEKHSARVLRGAGGQAEDVLAFTLSLTHELTAAQQVRSCEMLLRYVAALPAEADGDTPSPELFVDVARMDNKHLRAFRLVALDFAHRLLTSRQLGTVLTAQSTADPALAAQSTADAALAAVAEAQLALIAQLAAQHEQLAAAGRLETPVAERAWRQALALSYSVLDDANALMSRPAFVATVVRLLGQSDLRVRRRAMALAATRLGSFDTRRASDADIDQALELLPPVVATAALPGDGDDLVMCKQAALLCVATAARKFSALRPALFTALAEPISGAHSLGAAQPAVASAAMAALAALCDQLGSRLIPALPQYLPAVLKHLCAAVARFADASEDDLALLLGALAVLQAVVENMGAFLAPSLPPLLGALLSPMLRSYSRGADTSAEAALREQARGRSDELLSAVARSVPPRLLVPALAAFYRKSASRQGAAATVAVVDFVGRTGSALQHSHLAQFHRQLFRFLLGVFDVARSPGVQRADADAVEQAALDALMRVVVKLSETLFRPLFLSFLEWATADPAPAPAACPWAAPGPAPGSASGQHADETRLRVFYRALNALFAQLKSILTPYYASVIDTTTAQLARYAVALDSVEAQEEADRREKPVPGALWTAVVDSIRHCAQHDSGDFWTEDMFRRVARPLANQLANVKTTATSAEQAYDGYIERIRTCLAPAASQLAAAAGNDAMWKILNQDVMLKARSDYAPVREAALVVLRAFYDRLGEEFLILLPETIPFLAELLEDDDKRVERATHETIKAIELHLGESLQSYLR